MPPRLWAISDLHVGYPENRRLVQEFAGQGTTRQDPAGPGRTGQDRTGNGRTGQEVGRDDWLILAGDTGEAPAHLDFVLRALRPRFAQVVWVPGNHDLWTPQSLPSAARGVAHYERLVRLCRTYDVLTPEDGYAVWPGNGQRTAIVPAFTLYDYSFRPAGVERQDAVAWAAAHGVRCADEELLDATPYSSRDDWCHARVAATTTRLAAVPDDTRIILINHWPLRYEHATPPRVPRFSIWCGTRATDDWHQRFAVDTVIYGHLHLRSSRAGDGVRFEEVSLGYPGQWNRAKTLQDYLRRIR